MSNNYYSLDDVLDMINKSKGNVQVNVQKPLTQQDNQNCNNGLSKWSKHLATLDKKKESTDELRLLTPQEKMMMYGQIQPTNIKEEPIQYKRKNYTVIKVRRIPKPLKSSQKVYIKTDIDLIDLDPVNILKGDEEMAIYVDKDLNLLVKENKITEEVKDKLIRLYLDGEVDLMTELKNLIFSIHCDVNNNNRMDIDRWDKLVCSDISADVLSHSEFMEAAKANNITSRLDLPKNDYYLLYHLVYTGDNDKAEFFRCISYGTTKETTKVCNIFRI